MRASQGNRQIAVLSGGAHEVREFIVIGSGPRPLWLVHGLWVQEQT